MKLLSKKEVAVRYRVSTRTVENWLKFLPHFKVLGVVRFDPDLCDKVLLQFERNAHHRILGLQKSPAMEPKPNGGEHTP